MCFEAPTTGPAPADLPTCPVVQARESGARDARAQAAPSPVVPIGPQAHLLVVDDDPISLRLMRTCLEKRGHRVTTSSSVVEAQEQVERLGVSAFQGVLTDYRMPEKDGLEFLLWLHERDSTLATIMVTAEGEKNVVARSLRGGAHGFLDKPVNVPELYLAVTQAIESTRRRRQLAATESAVKEVGETQSALLGAHANDSVARVATCFHPKYAAGGDFVTVFPLGTERFVVLATDVSGHDLKSAFIAAYFQGIVRGMMEKAASIHEVFAFFNRFLAEEWNARRATTLAGRQTETSVAACAASVSLHEGRLTLLNCGFPLPQLVDAAGWVSELQQESSGPLGWFAEAPAAECPFGIRAGGNLFLWSDGLEEFAGQLGINPWSLVARLRAARENGSALAFLQDAPDDILVVTVDLNSGRDPATASLPVIAETHAGDQWSQIDELQAGWERSLQFAVPELSEATRYDLLLCAREALLNALRHGCGGAAATHARLQVNYLPDQKILRLRVSDPGPGHNFSSEAHERVAGPDLIDEHRGLMLLRHLSQRLLIERNGACLILDFPLNSENQT